MSEARTRLRRLVGFPLLILYVLTLVVAAWPRLLQPIPGTVTTVQLVALQLLHFATIYPGQEVFTGAGRPSEIPAGTCFRITGRTVLGREIVLFDDLRECRSGHVYPFKDPFDIFQARRLEHAFRHVRSPATDKNLNEFPLVYLYAIVDHYCRNAGERVEVVSVQMLSHAVDYETGARRQELTEEGFLRCGSSQWVRP